MINVEGRILQERRAKGGVADSRATRNHLKFSNFGIVGNDDPECTNSIHGKKKLEPKPAEEINLRGKKVLTEDEIRVKFGKTRRFGKLHIKPYKAAHDGEEKPPGAPPGANLTSRQRAEKIVNSAVHQDPTLNEAVAVAKQHFGEDNGIFEAVKLVQRAEAAKHVEKRDTKAAHLRSDDEPSKLVAPFFQHTTQKVADPTLRYSKRMLADPATTVEERSPARPQGIKRGSASNASTGGIPFDTAGFAATTTTTTTVTAAATSEAKNMYPDPPKVGKGKEIQEPQGKKRVGVKTAAHDLDELAQLKAVSRCGAHAGSEFPKFVLGDPGPAPKVGKNASPERNKSQIALGGDNLVSVASSPPSTSRPSTAATSSSQTPAMVNRRNAFAHVKNASTSLW